MLFRKKESMEEKLRNLIDRLKDSKIEVRLFKKRVS